MRWLALCALIAAGHRGPVHVHPERLAAPSARLVPSASHTVLRNGVRLILARSDRSPTLTVVACFRSGSGDDPKGRGGVADLLADVLTKGTQTRSAPVLLEEVEYLGASLSAEADADLLTVTLRVLAKDAERGVELLADVLTKPTFPAEEVERSRKITLAGLESLQEQGSDLAARAADEVGYRGTRYDEHPTRRSVADVSRENLATFGARFVRPDRMVVAVVGSLPIGEAEAILRRRLEHWQAQVPGDTELRTAAGRPRAETPPSYTAVTKDDATQVHLRWIGPGVRVGDPSAAASELASTIMGGGFTSRLVQTVRVANSLTYGVASSVDARVDCGRASISTFTKEATAARCVALVEKVAAGMARSGVRGDELERAKAYLAGQYSIALRDPDVYARRLAAAECLGLPRNHVGSTVDRLKSATLAAVNSAARRLFDPARMAVIAVGPGRSVGRLCPSRRARTIRSAADVGR